MRAMHLQRRSRLRLITVGSVPPDWGGATSGGVATFHQAFLKEVSEHRVELVGTMPLNLDPAADSPVGLNYLRAGNEAREWYLKTIARLAPDVVKFFHIGHRWAKWHVDNSDIPAVGSVRSWHQITHQSREHADRSRKLVKHVLARMNALIFPSEHARREGRQLGFSYACPTHVIPNHLHQRLSATSLRDGPRRGIVFAGSLISRKRADMVIRAAAELGVPVTILGEGPERQKLEQLANELGASICFRGSLSIDEVIAAYQRAELLCVPSTSESFGNVYLEAAACGTPSVGFAPTLAEISEHVGYPIGQGVDGDATASEVTAAVDRVLATQWDRHRLRARVIRLSPKRTVGRYLEVLRSVV